MNEVARNIFDLSGGTDLITNYNIELPPHWRNTECTANHLVLEGQLASEADIEIRGTHPLTGDKPQSLQYGGCGVRGQRVEIPFNVLTDKVDISSELLTQSILEVTRWRYGVFAEVGVAGDSMYPLNSREGISEVVNIGCTEDQMKSGGGLCPLVGNNNQAKTKQNLLCSGASARRSILSQFSTKDGAKFVKPEIEFVMPLDTKRVILILDHSSAMGGNWKSVLASTFQFINSLREGTELAIVSFSETATIHLQPTRVEVGNREGLHYRIPRRLSGGREEDEEQMKSCLDCAIELAQSLATNTTSILLLSSYVYFDSKNNSNLMEFEQSAKPIFHWLVFGSASGQAGSHHQHIDNNVFLINELHENTLNITSQTNLALATTIKDYPSQKFHHEVLTMNQNLEGSFSVEASLSSDLWLQLLVEDTTDINVFEIKSPSGQVFSFPKFDAGLVYFTLRGPRETGVWSYKIKLYLQERKNSNLVLECWATGHQGQVSISAWTQPPVSSNHPLIVYAKLEQADIPVSGVEVTALISRNNSPDPITIQLVDSGSGYPDITAGDGIYSAYFTQFSGEPALYSVLIQAINNSTASVINIKKLENITISFDGSSVHPQEPSIPLESFRRFTTAPSFYNPHGSEYYISSSSVKKRDVFPPNRVTDFSLTNYFNNSLFVTLSWTAPGDDFTLGTSFRYEIRCFTAQDVLSEDNFGEQGILIHSSQVPSPEPVGSEQRCTVGVPWTNEVFYYFIVAFDVAGNRGQVSNSVAVYVEEPVTTTNEPSMIKVSNMTDVRATQPLKSFIQSESLMYIIAGIISLILIIIVIILTVIIRRLGGSWKKNDPSSLSSSVPASCNSPSLPDLCHEQSFTRNSVSYISGYDLPEMLEYAPDHPQKATAQEHQLNSRPRVQEASDSSQYLGMNTCSLYHVSPSFMSPLPHIDISNYTAINVHKEPGLGVPTTQKYNTVAGVTKIYTREFLTGSPTLASSSVSPVNSIYTAGHSTDCSVSVSGSDNELIRDSLQVVMIPPSQAPEDGVDQPHLKYQPSLQTISRPEPKPKPHKIPPAVPNKTVHASLV